MHRLCQHGDQRSFQKVVADQDIAAFDSGTVHNVYATFSIARDAEWSGRLFVLDMKEAHEEGIGTFIHVNHRAPAFVGETVTYIATFEEITERNEIITSFKAYCGERLIADGRQGQKIISKEKLALIMNPS